MPSYLSAASGQAASSALVAVPPPASVVNGTVLVACHGVYGGTIGAMTVPDGGGWELLGQRDEGSSVAHSKLWWKRVSNAAGEPEEYLFPQGSGTKGVAIIVAVSGASTEAPQDGLSTTGTGSNINTPSLTPLGLADLDIRFGFGFIASGTFSLSSTPPSGGYTERADLQTPIGTAGPVIGTAATRQLAGGAAAGARTFSITGGSLDYDHGYTVLVTDPPPPRQVRPIWTNVPAMRASRW